jgi:hypothetical protein
MDSLATSRLITTNYSKDEHGAYLYINKMLKEIWFEWGCKNRMQQIILDHVACKNKCIK